MATTKEMTATAGVMGDNYSISEISNEVFCNVYSYLLLSSV